MFEFQEASHSEFNWSMAYIVCHAPLELKVRFCRRSVTIATMKLPIVVLSNLAE